MRGAILFPQQRQGDALATQLLVDSRPVAPRTGLRRPGGRRREQQKLERVVVEGVGQRPAKAGQSGALKM